MSTEPQTGPYIDFQHVSKAFGDNHVLDDVSFDVMPGETVCILGRSGVGKSVSLHHIMGFLKPDSGRIIVAYEDITDYPDEQMERIRKKVTMVFQNGALFDSLDRRRECRLSAARTRGHERRADFPDRRWPARYGGRENPRSAALRSLHRHEAFGGDRPRAGGAARCVLYDEPTTMVDPLMAQLLGDLIKRLKVQLQLTSIVVTHDMRWPRSWPTAWCFSTKRRRFSSVPSRDGEMPGADRAGIFAVG